MLKKLSQTTDPDVKVPAWINNQNVNLSIIRVISWLHCRETPLLKAVAASSLGAIEALCSFDSSLINK